MRRFNTRVTQGKQRVKQVRRIPRALTHIREMF
jgi:hypothetical protein